MEPYSSIYLTINPEVQMNLNRQGTVVGLTGTNEDGEALLEGYDGKGKDKVTVADELIDRAIEMGFLSDGGQVSVSIESPDAALFQAYGMELRTGVTKHLDGRITVTIEIVNHKDWREQESQESSASPNSSQQAASPPASTLTSSSEPSRPEVIPPTSSSPTDYDATDYGPNHDGVADYNDTDYGPGSDGVTDYTDGNTDYDPYNGTDDDADDDGDSGYNGDDNDDNHDDGDDDD